MFGKFNFFTLLKVLFRMVVTAVVVLVFAWIMVLVVGS